MSDPHYKTLLARQGIYNSDGSIFAYELLYRNDESFIAKVDNLNEIEGDIATYSVISQLFANLDMQSVLGNKRAFINFNYSQLIQKIPSLLPKNRIMIEILETVIIDESLINTIRALHDQGYSIVLDDFIYHEKFIPLIAMATIIKIDVKDQTKDQIIEQLKPLKNFKGKLLAEKVEDRLQFNWCKDLGFDYFQGFFFNKPAPFKGRAITENKSNLIRLMAELNNEDVGIERIEEIILQIPKLSYRIMRLANSTFMHLGRKIESLLDAIGQLGLVQIRTWVNLLLLASIDDMPSHLLEQSLVRAKMCESLAASMGYSNPHQAYTVGIFSTLDGILNESMESLLSKIQLIEVLNDALLYKKGELGKILQFTLDYEHANFNSLKDQSIIEEDFIKSYIDGIEHANEVMLMVKSI